MDYTAADIKKLREETGATFADCKNALTNAKLGMMRWAIKTRSAERSGEDVFLRPSDERGGISPTRIHNNRLEFC